MFENPPERPPEPGRYLMFHWVHISSWPSPIGKARRSLVRSNRQLSAQRKFQFEISIKSTFYYNKIARLQRNAFIKALSQSVLDSLNLS